MAGAEGGYTGFELVKRPGDPTAYQIALAELNNYHFFPLLFHPVSPRFIEPSAINYPFRKTLLKLRTFVFDPVLLKKLLPEKTKLVQCRTGQVTT